MVALPGNDATAATAAVGRVLNDPDRPMKERFRALFTLRNIGGEEAVNHVRLADRLYSYNMYKIMYIVLHTQARPRWSTARRPISCLPGFLVWRLQAGNSKSGIVPIALNASLKGIAAFYTIFL